MKHKKILAAKVLGISPKKVRFADDALEDIKKAITKSDIRGLVAIGKITKSTKSSHSRARARKIAFQKRKGRQKGRGTRKGSKYSRVSRKEQWIGRIRVQRGFLKELKEKEMLNNKNYRMLYDKCSGGFFRNKRHIKLYINEQHLIEGKKAEVKKA